MLKASSRIGVSATTLRVAGLWPTSAISPTIDPGPIVGDVLPAGEHAGVAVDHEEALGAHVALVHEDRRRPRRPPARRSRRSWRRRPRGRWRTAAAGAGPRSPPDRPCVTACCFPPRCVAGSTYPGRDHFGGVDRPVPQRGPRAWRSRRRRWKRWPRAARRRPRGRARPVERGGRLGGGGGGRLAVPVGARGGDRVRCARRRRAPDRGRAPAARWCAPAPRGAASTPAAPGQHQGERPGPEPVGHLGRRRHRLRQRERLRRPTRTAPRSARRRAAPSARTPARPRAATSAARPARTRCPSAAPRPHRARSTATISSTLRQVVRATTPTLPTPTPAACGPARRDRTTQARVAPSQPVSPCRTGRHTGSGWRQRRATRARSRPARSGSIRTSVKPAARRGRGRRRPGSRRSRRRGCRSGASHSAAPATITSMASRPVGPGTSAPARLPVGDLGRAAGRRRRRRAGC